MNDNDKAVNDAFKQLDGALCLWARAKGEQPANSYFRESTVSVRELTLDGVKYQVVLTKVLDEDKKT
jgi:hypothetical protein